MVKIRPLFGNVLIKSIERKEGESGILMPTSTKISNIGEVLSVGGGEQTNVINPRYASSSSVFEFLKITPEIKIGDKILYKPSDTTPVEDLFLINQRDILAILDEN